MSSLGAGENSRGLVPNRCVHVFVTTKAAPVLGEQTGQALSELEYDAAMIDRLRTERTIGQDHMFAAVRARPASLAPWRSRFVGTPRAGLCSAGS